MHNHRSNEFDLWLMRSYCAASVQLDSLLGLYRMFPCEAVLGLLAEAFSLRDRLALMVAGAFGDDQWGSSIDHGGLSIDRASMRAYLHDLFPEEILASEDFPGHNGGFIVV